LRSPARFQRTAEALRDLLLAHPEAAQRDPSLRERVSAAWMDAQAYALSTYMTASRLHKGGHIGAESSTNKVFWSELDLRMHQTALDILGAQAEIVPQSADERARLGHWLDGFLFAQAGPIYAGTNEIQRNIVAERMLGMPRG
jgi:alkylation response protein AidB-like acyl-CoA dehydrogenase